MASSDTQEDGHFHARPSLAREHDSPQATNPLTIIGSQTPSSRATRSDDDPLVPLPTTPSGIPPVVRGQTRKARPPTPVLPGRVEAKPRYGARKIPTLVEGAAPTSFVDLVQPFRYDDAGSGAGAPSSDGETPEGAVRSARDYHLDAAPVVTPVKVKDHLRDFLGKRSRRDSLESAEARKHWAPWTAEQTDVTSPLASPLPFRPHAHGQNGQHRPLPVLESREVKLATLKDAFPGLGPDIHLLCLNQAIGDVEKAAHYATEHQIRLEEEKEKRVVEPPKKKGRFIKKGDRRTDSPDDVEIVAVTHPSPAVPSDPPVAVAYAVESDGDATDVDDDGDAYAGVASEDDVDDLDRRTVKFFNEATPLMMSEAISQCTLDQGNFIVGLRPFRSLSHLEDTLSGHKGQRLAKLPERYRDVLEGYSEVDSLIQKCEKYGDEVMSVLKAWTRRTEDGGVGAPDDELDAAEISLVHVDESVQGDEDDVADVDVGDDVEAVEIEKDIARGGRYRCLRTQPVVVNQALTLKSYQLVGVSWLYMLYCKGLGGILADEVRHFLSFFLSLVINRRDLRRWD
ncbi:hypothetical protein HKX48_001772 [Thoreauomyces humboldtii]|nr:hypothetical protein HKX48_001772 [Thoreauomyces humboldtii]